MYTIIYNMALHLLWMEVVVVQRRTIVPVGGISQLEKCTGVISLELWLQPRSEAKQDSEGRSRRQAERIILSGNWVYLGWKRFHNESNLISLVNGWSFAFSVPLCARVFFFFLPTVGMNSSNRMTTGRRFNPIYVQGSSVLYSARLCTWSHFFDFQTLLSLDSKEPQGGAS